METPCGHLGREPFTLIYRGNRRHGHTGGLVAAPISVSQVRYSVAQAGNVLEMAAVPFLKLGDRPIGRKRVETPCGH